MNREHPPWRTDAELDRERASRAFVDRPPTEAEIRAEIARRGGVVVRTTAYGMAGPVEARPADISRLVVCMKRGARELSAIDVTRLPELPVLIGWNDNYKSDARRTEAAIRLIPALWGWDSWSVARRLAWFGRLHRRIALEVLGPRLPEHDRAAIAGLIADIGPEAALHHELFVKAQTERTDDDQDAVTAIMIEEAAK